MFNKLLIVLSFVLLTLGCVEVDDRTTPNSLIRLEDVPTSENCADGETAIYVGIDTDSDGQLSNEEIINTYYVCNGQENTETANLIRIDDEPPGGNCTDGGVAIHIGGDINNDSNLSDEEIINTTYVCTTSSGGNGSYLESSDGKYIGEIIGVANPNEYFYSSCVFVYNADADGFFGVTLETGIPCNTSRIYFENISCTFSGSIYTTFPAGTSWRILNPTNMDVYAVTSEKYDVYANSRASHQTGECDQCEDSCPWHIDKLQRLEYTSVTIDFGQPPILVKTP